MNATNIIALPSRYEDLNEGFRGRLQANSSLIEIINRAFKRQDITGGIGFLPIYGASGSGKTSATMELGTHLPGIHIIKLSQNAISSKEQLLLEVRDARLDAADRPIVAIIDQYEEAVATKLAIPTSFVESLSLLDRNELRKEKIIFIWLTTSLEFQELLVEATTRNRRILIRSDFEITGPDKAMWPSIVADTFSAHNSDAPLSDYDILPLDIIEISKRKSTLGDTIESVAERLADELPDLQNLSEYRVVMLWPVTDGARINLIHMFTEPKQGYKLNFDAWYRNLNTDDQQTLPLHAFNRARLYFDFRLIPIAAADLQPICKDIDSDTFSIFRTYKERIESTHLFSIVADKWDSERYAPLRERRETTRAKQAREWYPTVTTKPQRIGRRLAQCFTEMGISAKHEEPITTRHSTVNADVLCQAPREGCRKTIIEIKAFSPENTMPSSITAQIRTTMRRHAHLAGFLEKQ